MPKIEKYEVVQRLARGGMAEVFLAWFEEKGRRVPVALKRILPEVAKDKDVKVMLLDEARISARLVHPGIAQTLDLGKVGETYFLVVEYVDGRELRAVFDAMAARQEMIPPIVLAYVLEQAALALDFAHRLADEKGKPMAIVHRDISPANIMVAFDGSAKVIDFGIARAADRMTRTAMGVVKGKYRYISPEQALAKTVDHRSDLYSLGVVLYEGLAGHPILPGLPEARVPMEVIDGKVPSLAQAGASAPPALEALVTRAMSMDVSERPASGAAMAHELASFVASNGGEALARRMTVELLKLLFPEGPMQLKKAIGQN